MDMSHPTRSMDEWKDIILHESTELKEKRRRAMICDGLALAWAPSVLSMIYLVPLYVFFEKHLNFRLPMVKRLAELIDEGFKNLECSKRQCATHRREMGQAQLGLCKQFVREMLPEVDTRKVDETLTELTGDLWNKPGEMQEKMASILQELVGMEKYKQDLKEYKRQMGELKRYTGGKLRGTASGKIDGFAREWQALWAEADLFSIFEHRMAEWMEQLKEMCRGGNQWETALHEMEELMVKFHDQLRELKDYDFFGNKKIQLDRDRFVEKWQKLWAAMVSEKEKVQLEEDTHASNSAFSEQRAAMESETTSLLSSGLA